MQNCDDESYNTNDKMTKINKVNIAKKRYRPNKFIIEEGRENEDAMKIDRLVNGYGQRRPYVKQSTGSAFSDASGKGFGVLEAKSLIL